MTTAWVQLLKLRRAYKSGDWPQSLLHNAAQLARDNPRLRHLHLYTDIRQALAGFDNESVLQLEQNCLQQKRYKNSAMHYRVLALKRKHHLLEQNELKSLEVTPQLTRYPQLLAKIPVGSVSGRKFLRLKTLADNLDRRCSTLEAFVHQSPLSGSYCVVGNAPTEQGKKQQSVIDNCDVVFRFNRVHNTEQHQNAYGSRTDAWVISPSFNITQQEAITNHVFVSGIAVFDKPSRYWQTFARQNKMHFYSFPDKVWYQLVAKLSAPPTAGLLCIASLQRHLDPSNTLSVFGVSRDHGSANYHYGDKGKRSARHNWKLECRLVNELLPLQEYQPD